MTGMHSEYLRKYQSWMPFLSLKFRFLWLGGVFPLSHLVLLGVFNAILRSFPSGMTFRAVSKEATKLTISFSKPPVPSVDVSLYQTS